MKTKLRIADFGLRIKKIIFAAILISLFSILNSCKSSFDEPKYTSGNANFQRTVAVGGGFLSGYQDGALFLDGQQNSVPSLLATQFKLAGGGEFNQPLMLDYTGIGLSITPWRNTFQKRAVLGYYTDCKGERSLFPLDNSLSVAFANPYLEHVPYILYNDCTVPFAKIQSLLDPALGGSFSFDTSNLYYGRFASNQGVSTVIEDAMKVNPTFFIAWFGVEDVYNYAMKGGAEGSMTHLGFFSNTLDQILEKISASGTGGVIANIPDLNTFPFFTTVGPRALKLTKNQADSLNNLTGNIFNFIEGENGFIIEDAASTFGYRQMTSDEMLLLSVPLDSVKCNYLGVFPDAMPNKYVLDKKEIESINLQISLYNTAIAAKADKYKIPMVDMNSFFKSVKDGITKDGVKYNAEFIKGGFFSLDGFHPNQKGYGLIANEFIKSINSYYKSNLPLTRCVDCKGIRFP